MKKNYRTIALLMALAFTGAQSVYACEGCGCTKKQEDKKAGACIAAEKGESGAKSCASKEAVKTPETPKQEACESGVCSLSGAPDPAEKADHHNITTLQLKEYVDSGGATILDARSGKYDDGYRIPGAKALSSLSTEEEVAAMLPDKGALIVTYCSNLQCPASKRLADHLKKLGYTQVHEYPEGIAGWRAAGGKVDKAQ